MWTKLLQPVKNFDQEYANTLVWTYMFVNLLMSYSISEDVSVLGNPDSDLDLDSDSKFHVFKSQNVAILEINKFVHSMKHDPSIVNLTRQRQLIH